MGSDFMLAMFVIAVGLSFAGAVTHFYQMLWRQPAMLRFDGATYVGTLGHLLVSFLGGPYIMLQLGFQPREQGQGNLVNALLAAFISFGWSFLTGLLVLGLFLATSGL